MTDGHWLQKEYILVHMLTVRPPGSSKMTIPWNSTTVSLQDGVSLEPSDGNRWQDDPRDLGDGVCRTAARLRWVERRLEDKQTDGTQDPSCKGRRKMRVKHESRGAGGAGLACGSVFLFKQRGLRVSAGRGEEAPGKSQRRGQKERSVRLMSP